jgi:DNA-binding CsgD family transcriptional regulator
MDMLAKGGVPAGALPADSDAGLGAGLALVLDELAHGVLVTTVEGRLLHANHAARHELARHRAVFARDDVLHPCDPASARTLSDALARAGEGKRSLVELVAPEGGGLTLAVLPLKAEAPGSAPRVALLFARASICESLMLCFFARSHGLTATEEHVLGILCHGFSAPEVARQLDVAVSTVRSHVRSLCAKTRSSGVRELVNRVAVLPPVAPPFRHEPMH